MASFFESMRRLVQGKPVFDPADHPEHLGASQAPQNSTPVQVPASPPTPENSIQKGNDRTFPVVYVKRTTSRLNGQNMQVYCWIVNDWAGHVELDKIRILNESRDLNATLRPKEGREFLVFSGKRPTTKYHQAEIEYKTAESGDYFKSIHDLDFTFHPDKTYSVDDLKLHRPIRDIYG